ncbi:MAG: galactokinase [Thermoanaerobaculia bacterium]|nr:galactokinase [Thermoanaerobaculia bacterium]
MSRVSEGRVASALSERFGRAPGAVVARAPGRVNLIGEHTDYNQGLVLPTPVGRYLEVAARATAERRIRLLAVDLDATFETDLCVAPSISRPGWASYVLGVMESLQYRGLLDAGVDLALGGTVPRGAGLSSSAALETATLLALEGVFGFELEPVEAARLCHQVEERWAGVRCGIMDQMASRLGLPDHGLRIDCRDFGWRQIPLPLSDHAFVITDSRSHRQLSGSAFNERRRDCEEAVAILSQDIPSITSLRDVDEDILAENADQLPPRIARRCRHVVAENDRVREAERCLIAGDLGRFGELMTASHESLRDDYEVSSPRLDRLVDTALGMPGVLGSRLTGAGFGGCTVTLARRDAVPALRSALEEELRQCGVADAESSGAVWQLGPAIRAGIVDDGAVPLP